MMFKFLRFLTVRGQKTIVLESAATQFPVETIETYVERFSADFLEKLRASQGCEATLGVNALVAPSPAPLVPIFHVIELGERTVFFSRHKMFEGGLASFRKHLLEHPDEKPNTSLEVAVLDSQARYLYGVSPAGQG